MFCTCTLDRLRTTASVLLSRKDVTKAEKLAGPAKAQRSCTESVGPTHPGQDKLPPRSTMRGYYDPTMCFRRVGEEIPRRRHCVCSGFRSSPASLRRAATASSISVTESCFSNRSHRNRLIVPRPSRRQSPLTCTVPSLGHSSPFGDQGGVTPSPCLGTRTA